MINHREHPMDRYNRSMSKREEEFMNNLREASLRDDMSREKIHNRLYSSTHAAPGMLLGSATGVGAGALAGIKAIPHNRSTLAVPLALAGGLLGGAAGFQIGGRIRKNKDKNLSANLKPALRELSDRSEGLVEFGAVDQTMRELRLPLMKGTAKHEKRQIYEAMRDTGWSQTAVDPKQASKWQKGIYNARENRADSSHNRSGEKAREMLLPGKRLGKREFARGDFLRQAVGKYSDVAPAVVPGVSPSVVGPRGKEWRSQFLLWARKRAAKQMV